jgi:HTH-type transcriptional regulator / antitoxin HigA
MKAELIVIQNESDYAAAMVLVRSLMQATDAKDIARLRAQARLIQAWESERWPARKVDAVEAIKFRLEQRGMKRSDLVKIIGSKSKVSEVLNRRRRLSLAMIQRLHKHLDIPAEILIARAA